MERRGLYPYVTWRGERNVPSNHRMIFLKMYVRTKVRSPEKWHSTFPGGVKEDCSEEAAFELRLEE